jgi:hypothetical protein
MAFDDRQAPHSRRRIITGRGAIALVVASNWLSEYGIFATGEDGTRSNGLPVALFAVFQAL